MNNWDLKGQSDVIRIETEQFWQSCSHCTRAKISPVQCEHSPNYQAIPGNDQNASPTNQKTPGSKLDRTSSWRHLESFSGGFLVRMFAGMSSQILGEKFDI